MGDGSRWMHENQNNAFRVTSMTKPFLEWLSEELGVLGREVKKSPKSPEDTARDNRERGFHDGNAKDYAQLYVMRTRAHPFLNEFLDRWYTDSGIQFPNDIELTPTILKMWYVSDGSVKIYPYPNGVQISNTTQENREEYFTELFKEIGIDLYFTDTKVNIIQDQTEQFFEYIGNSPTDSDAGFKYKWQHNDVDEYQKLKEIHDAQPYNDRDDRRTK